jgi:hypothetical protein
VPDAAADPIPLPQHLDALASAERVRRGMADVRDRIRTGRASLDVALLGDLDDGVNEIVDRMRVYRLLRCAPRVGPSTATKIMAAVMAPSETKRVGQLTTRQRDELARVARGMVPWACQPASDAA